MKKAVKKKPSVAPATVPPKTVAVEMEPEESETVVICLRVYGGARISIDVARDRHDGRNSICCMSCGNQCVRHIVTKPKK